MLNKILRKRKFSESNFITLFLAITYLENKVDYINRFRLQEKLAKFYDAENTIFEDIDLKEENDKKYLSIESGFTYAIAYGLLVTIHDNTKDLIYIINMSEKSATRVLNEYDPEIVNAMTKLVNDVFTKDEEKVPQRISTKINES